MTPSKRDLNTKFMGTSDSKNENDLDETKTNTSDEEYHEMTLSQQSFHGLGMTICARFVSRNI